ncbi:hypothetical protein JXV03_002670 [Salmonella enterica]|nr:hypothetical protein [Salmonella enterica]EGY5260435.1 hypothetical protein [Salmonella enterica]EHB5336627.1 hypothetical protein [Salmonella enterica]EIC7155587.1 hypothetical protein [Salmonella enterica]
MRHNVFPAPAGINRLLTENYWQKKRVPRASGDKPKAVAIESPLSECSPRQRG